MKAVVYDSREKLVIRDVPLPELGPNEVLIKVVNTGFCGSDHSMIESGSLKDGTIIGHEVSGTVEDVGSAVRNVEMGSRIMIRQPIAENAVNAGWANHTCARLTGAP